MKALRYYFISIFCLLLISCQKSDTEPYWERIPLSSEDDWILVTSMLRNGDKIYFGTSYRGIYTLDKSTNQWSHADSNSGSVYIKIDIWQENLVLMTVGDIYLSSNDGFSRNSIRPGDYYFRDMLITDSAIFVTTEENGLFKSNNGGASWTRLDSQLFSDAMSLTSSSDGVMRWIYL